MQQRSTALAFLPGRAGTLKSQYSARQKVAFVFGLLLVGSGLGLKIFFFLLLLIVVRLDRSDTTKRSCRKNSFLLLVLLCAHNRTFCIETELFQMDFLPQEPTW